MAYRKIWRVEHNGIGVRLNADLTTYLVRQRFLLASDDERELETFYTPAEARSVARSLLTYADRAETLSVDYTGRSS